jgi:hypothetical protein
MARQGKFVTKIAAFAVGWLTYGPAVASIFHGELPVGYSDNLFQIDGSTSFLGIDINANGTRDPAICAFCYSIYTDNYTVNLFNQAGALLESAKETNYFYYNKYTNSHGIGAGPVGLAVPIGTTTVEIISRLSIAGLLGADGLPLSFGDLYIFGGGPITAATPLPAALPLFAGGLGVLGFLARRRMKKASSSPLALYHRGSIKLGPSDWRIRS